MYSCSKCNSEVIVDHINPPKFTCECVDAVAVTNMGGHATGSTL